MNGWDVGTLDLRPGAPTILSTTDDARAIALELPAGGELQRAAERAA